MCQTTRRGFLVGCSSAIASLAGARFNSLAFGSPSSTDEVMVVIFLRGGMDGLSLVMPIAGHPDRGYYEAARPDIQVPTSGTSAALALASGFGVHPGAARLRDLYQAGHLAIVHAAGITGPEGATRSHFEAMDYLELGTPGNDGTTTGWLTRHLATADLPPAVTMPAIAIGGTQTTSLLGSRETINMESVGDFSLDTGPWSWRSMQRQALRELYQGESIVHRTGRQTLDAVDIIELNASGTYTPANGAVYPSGSFGDQLKVVAQMIKLGLGLRVATLDLGGWDTHTYQGNGGTGYFGDLAGDLADGLHALYLDLDSGYTQRLTVLVQSEFGRRVRQNDDDGTDHGHGNLMLVLSGHATPGFHGTWPGLRDDQLFEGADLAVTTDYRRVLSEILIRRLGNPFLGSVFPGYVYPGPLGIVSGTDLPPDYSAPLFKDGFEDGSMSRWPARLG